MLQELRKHESEVLANVDDLKTEFVSDWEDEFDDIHEAYEEQGRGQAESQALMELIDRIAKEEGLTVSDDDKIFYMDELADEWGLSLV